MKQMKTNFIFSLLAAVVLTNTPLHAKEAPKLPMADYAKMNHGTVFKERMGNLAKLGYHDGLIYGYAYVGRQLTLFQINNKGNVAKTVELEIPDYQNNNRYIESLIMVNGKINLFTTCEDKKLDKQYLLHQFIDESTLQVESKITKLEEMTYENRRGRGYFNVIHSKNETKVLTYKALPTKKGAKEKIELTVYTNEMDEIWSEEIDAPESGIHTILVDDDGDVFIAFQKYKGQDLKELSREERKSNHVYDMAIWFIRKKGTDIKEFIMEVEGKWLTDVRFGATGDGKISAGGFYSEKNMYGIKGVFFVSIDKETRKLTSTSLKEFDVEFLYANLSEKGKEKAKKKEAEGKGRGMLSFDFHELVMRPDGGVILIAEQNYMVKNCYTDPRTGRTTCTYTYYSNDIVVVNINPKGDIEWAKWIPKKQTSGTYTFQSYHLHVSDRLYFIYYDVAKNYAEPDGKVKYSFGGPKKAIVTIAALDLEGNLEKKVLSVKDPQNLYLVPKYGTQLNEKTSMLYFLQKSSRRFSILEINN